jgi:hypothetical protein
MIWCLIILIYNIGTLMKRVLIFHLSTIIATFTITKFRTLALKPLQNKNKKYNVINQTIFHL